MQGEATDVRPRGLWRRARGATALVAVVLLVAATACSSDDSGSTAATTTTAATSSTTGAGSTTTTTEAADAIRTTTPAPKKGEKYVALGSSIASGFGIPEQSTSCGRSSRDYAQLIKAQYGLALTDVTCGAAVIANVVSRPQGANPPQIDAVTEDTDLVTITVGGNDIVYNGTALQCGNPATVCQTPPTLDADLVRTGEDLQKMFRTVRAAAPEATIVFVTYPREIPAGNCAASGMTDPEAAVLRDMGERLEATMVKAVHGTDVVLVDPYVQPGDHTGCAPESQRWVAGKVAPDGFPYHPTALGHQEMASLIEHAFGS